MRHTVFNTPVIRHFFVCLSWFAFKITGWSVEGQPPTDDKYILIGGPHTSNWDFPLALGTAFLSRLDFYWLGKASLFKGPMGPIMRWFSGLPIDRRKSSNVVQSTIDAFNKKDQLSIVIAPEGTRSKVTEWKKGFYHIAHGAGVPIHTAYLDGDRKVIGFGPSFTPTGDVDKDVEKIQAFYNGFNGINTDK